MALLCCDRDEIRGKIKRNSTIGVDLITNREIVAKDIDKSEYEGRFTTFNAGDVLPKGTDTLCEALFMVQANERDTIEVDRPLKF